MIKTRAVQIFSGHRFEVPQCVQRIDHRYTHGWQVRYGGTKMFSDGSNDGSGAAKALQAATKELLARIAKLPAPTKLQQAPSQSKTSKLPVGISGPVLRTRRSSGVQHCSLQVLLPRWGQVPRNVNVYIGSRSTYTKERYKEALDKAIEMRRKAEDKYRSDETRARRAAAKAMREALKTGSQELPRKGPAKAAKPAPAAKTAKAVKAPKAAKPATPRPACQTFHPSGCAAGCQKHGVSGGGGSRGGRFELIVFDWDGTLFDSTALIVRCIQAACRDVGTTVPSDTQAAYVIGLGLRDALLHAAPDFPPERYAELGDRYRHHYFASQHELVLFDGTLPMLHALKARGHRLAVATGKSRRGLDEALATSQLKGVFDATRTADETASKPDPTMLHELMDELGIAPQRTVMIGDTSHDLLMAANAGVHSVAVSWGAHEHTHFEAHAPLAVVHSTGELDAWLADHG